MINKILYKVDVTLRTPLCIGSGINEKTDHDLLKDGNDNYILPGTTIAGVIRAYLDEETQNKMFGFISGRKSKVSPVLISDAIILNAKTNIRDGIAVGADGQTIDGAKFDFEIIQAGASSSIFVEINDQEDNEFSNTFDKLIKAIELGYIRFGFKTNRGFGQLAVKKVYKKQYTKDNYIDYINNKRVYSDEDLFENWKDVEIDSKYDSIIVDMTLMGGISIRTYSKTNENADYMHIKDNGKPVIPGTSWNGLFRSIASRYSECLSGLFEEGWGYVDQEAKENNSVPSQIRFSESVINLSDDKLNTRNKIDRFSASTIDGALYSELMTVGGTTKLQIDIGKDVYPVVKNLILMALKDINLGIETIGGLGSIGHGKMRVDKVLINGQAWDVETSDVNFFN